MMGLGWIVGLCPERVRMSDTRLFSTGRLVEPKPATRRRLWVAAGRGDVRLGYELGGRSNARGTIEAMSQSVSRNASQRFEAKQWVPYPVELVFAFFANPANLPHLMPRKFEMRLEDARIEPPPPRPVAADESRRFKSIAAGVGSEILISFIPFRGCHAG